MARIKFVCDNCGVEEDIPLQAIQICESMDPDGDPNYPPRFQRKHCGEGEMYPVKYKNPNGVTFRYDPNAPEKFTTN